MAQGILCFQYQEEQTAGGMTALAGLPLYLELIQAAGLRQSIQRHVHVQGSQGWTDSQVILSLLLLNVVGGEAVEDLRILEKDSGFCAVLRQAEEYGLSRKERQEQRRRWRKSRQRTVPSPSVVFRHLVDFHDPQEEERREMEETPKAFIPRPTTALWGLGKANQDLIACIQGWAPQKLATLDQDATLVESQKREARYSYRGTKAYQPLQTYWAEQGLLVHSEFRDGNVPAGYEQLRCLEEALAALPQGVETVRLRSDTAGYQHDLLRYCAQGKHPRFGVIEFAVGVDVTPEFREAVAEVAPEEWHPLDRVTLQGEWMATAQEWAEVCFVPEGLGRKKEGPTYRFLAVREALRQPPLPGMEEQLPFPTVEFASLGRYKVTGVVTNQDLPGDQLLRWYRQRCGKSEEVHGVLKEDLAGGKLPSGLFGANAAWWGIAVLAFNVHMAMKRLVLGGQWVCQRLKALRFQLLAVPGRFVSHARQWLLRLVSGHPAYRLLVEARQRVLALAHGPSG